jgi:Raf kinase inhibitor-like YbhB/YbcL family protein
MTGSMYRSMIRHAIAAAAAVALLAACDTGDGKTLKDTVVPTTLPPPDTAPLDSVAIDGAIDGAAGTGAAAEGSALPIVPTHAATGPMQLIGPWNDDAPIDALYTCDGDDISPALSWRDVPDAVVELALVVVDDDAGDAGDPVVHWVIAGFDPMAISLAEGEVPVGAIEATNSFGEVGWTGPCPPLGDGPHGYRFKLHALAQQIELGDGVPADEIVPYLEDLTIAAAELTGTYER